MNVLLDEALDLVGRLRKALENPSVLDSTQVILFPAFPLLTEVGRLIEDKQKLRGRERFKFKQMPTTQAFGGLGRGHREVVRRWLFDS